MPASAALAYLLDPDKHMVVNKVLIREGLTAIQTFKKLSEATAYPGEGVRRRGQGPDQAGRTGLVVQARGRQEG